MPGIPTTRQALRRQFISIAMSFVLGCLLVGPTGPAFSQTADERVWQQFLQWLSTLPPADRPAPIFEQYRARLLAAGIAASRCEPSNGRDKADATNSHGRLASDVQQHLLESTPVFDTNPNALLVSAVEGRTPGRALDVGMGQGRNAVFLAMKGWDVTGFDVSDEGLRIAQRNAERAGVKLNAVLQSDEQCDFGTARWDLVVIESFASESGSFNRRLVDIDPKELRRAFESVRILHFEETFALPDWGKERTRLARLIAEKKE